MVFPHLNWTIVSRITLAVTILSTSIFSATPLESADYTPAKERAWEHVQTVLMSSEYGGRSGVIERWVNSPSISIVGASGPDELFLHQLISNLNPKASIGFGPSNTLSSWSSAITKYLLCKRFLCSTIKLD